MAIRDEVAIRISARNEATPALAAIERGLRGLDRAAVSVSTRGGVIASNFAQLNEATGSYGGTLNRVVDRGVIGLGALTTGAVVWGLKTANSLQQSQIAFTTMFQSADKAKAFSADLQAFAKATPFDLQGLTQSTQRLLAYGFTAEQVLPTLRSIGDASAGLGAGTEGLDRMARALGQIQAKGRVQTQELLQLQEVGVPALEILGKGLGLNGIALSKAIESGTITAQKAIPILLAGLDDRFGGLMEAQSKTLGGQISNFRDALAIELASAVEPIMPQLTAELPGLADTLTKGIAEVAPQLPKLVDAGIALAPAAIDIALAFAKVSTSIAPVIGQVVDLLGPEGIRDLLGVLVAFRILTAAGGAVQAVIALTSAFKGLAGAQAAVAASSVATGLGNDGGVVPYEGKRRKGTIATPEPAPSRRPRAGGLLALATLGLPFADELKAGFDAGYDADGFVHRDDATPRMAEKWYDNFNPLRMVGQGSRLFTDAGGKLVDIARRGDTTGLAPADVGARERLGSNAIRDQLLNEGRDVAPPAAAGTDATRPVTSQTTWQFSPQINVTAAGDVDVHAATLRALQDFARDREARR